MSRVVLDETPAFEQLIQLFAGGPGTLMHVYFDIALVKLMYVFTSWCLSTKHIHYDNDCVIGLPYIFRPNLN